jgi:hypothetical protein
MSLNFYRIFVKSIVLTAIVVGIKYILHSMGLEWIVLGSLHGSVISGVIFVIGFILSATISDYKEAERIPAEIAATIEDMNEDALSIHRNYPKFNLAAYQDQLQEVASSMEGDLRNSKSDRAKTQLYALGDLHAAMEDAGVPANFIVKLKQQQAGLLRQLFRVNYIQRISFIPSATILAYAITAIAVAMLLFTQVEPFIGGMALTGIITFIVLYVLQLINVIKTPFHGEGHTKDDVSLFLIERTLAHIAQRKNK